MAKQLFLWIPEYPRHGFVQKREPSLLIDFVISLFDVLENISVFLLTSGQRLLRLLPITDIARDGDDAFVSMNLEGAGRYQERAECTVLVTKLCFEIVDLSGLAKQLDEPLPLCRIRPVTESPPRFSR